MGSELAAVVIGVPAMFWGTRLMLSGFYERQLVAQSEGQASSSKLWAGAGLMILGIALLGIVAMMAFTV